MNRHRSRVFVAASFAVLAAVGGAHGTRVTEVDSETPARGAAQHDFDPSTGQPYVPAPPVPDVLPSYPPLLGAQGGRLEVLWIETKGTLLDYDSAGNFATAVRFIESFASLDVQSKGAVTADGLAPYDIAIVPAACNYDLPFTAEELSAFRDFVEAGGGLFVMADNPATSDVAVTPLLGLFDLTCNLAFAGFGPWIYTNPALQGHLVDPSTGGHVGGGFTLLTDGIEPVGVFTRFGAGKVAVYGDVNIHANMILDANNLESLRIVLRILI